MGLIFAFYLSFLYGSGFLILVNMSARFIAGFIILLVVLFVAYDLYSYGIELKRAPLLMTNPLLVIQLHYQAGGAKELVKASCPEISKFKPLSPYDEYQQIPLSQWNACISKVSPSTLVRESCLEAQGGAQAILAEVNSQNEIVMGMEKYGVRFTATPYSRQITEFADGNVCVRAVEGYGSEKRLAPLGIKPSSILDIEKLGEGVSELDSQKLRDLASGALSSGEVFKDYRITSFLLLAGIFIFFLVIYTAYNQMQGKGQTED